MHLDSREQKQSAVDVFISRKSADRLLAMQLYQFLTALGVNVFESDESLPKLGNSDYRKAIDQALDECTHMLVLGSSAENISSSWVEAEWGFYISEKRAGRKKGNIVTVTSGDFPIAQLPASLRYYEVIAFDPDNFNRIAAYLGRSIGTNNEKMSSPATLVARRPSQPIFTGIAPHALQHVYTIDGCINTNTGEGTSTIESLDLELPSGGRCFLAFRHGSNTVSIHSIHNGELIQTLKTEHALSLVHYRSGLIFAVHRSTQIIRWHPTVPNNSNAEVQMNLELLFEIPTKSEHFQKPVIDQLIHQNLGSYSLTLLIREEEKDERGLLVDAYWNSDTGKYELSEGRYFEKLRSARYISEYAPYDYTNALVILAKEQNDTSHTWSNIVLIRTRNGERKIYANDITELRGDNRFLITLNHQDNQAIQYIDPSSDRQPEPIEYTPSASTRMSHRGKVIAYPHEDLVAALPAFDSLAQNIFVWARHHNRSKPGNFKQILSGHKKCIEHIEWSPSLYNVSDPANSFFGGYLHGWEARLLISSSKDGSIRIWEPETGRELVCFENCDPNHHPFCWALEGYNHTHLFLYADRLGFIHAFRWAKKTN